MAIDKTIERNSPGIFFPLRLYVFSSLPSSVRVKGVWVLWSVVAGAGAMGGCVVGSNRSAEPQGRTGRASSGQMQERKK